MGLIYIHGSLEGNMAVGGLPISPRPGAPLPQTQRSSKDQVGFVKYSEG